MYRDQYRKFKESPQRDMQPAVDVQDVDAIGGVPESGLDDMRPSDPAADHGEHVVQSVDQSHLNRSSKGRQ